MLLRGMIVFAVGLLVGWVWGNTQGSLWAGMCIGMTLGSGLGLILVLPRRSRRVLALPPWHAVVGAVLVGLGIGGMVRPDVVFDPAWVLVSLERVGEGPGFTLQSDQPHPPVNAGLTRALTQFRREIKERFFDPGLETCVVHVDWVHDRMLYEKAKRFGISSDFGYYSSRTLRGAVVVYPDDSGAGSLTHHLVYHLLSCGFPNGLVPWAREGTAAFFEKFVALELNGNWRFAFGYRHTWRDEALRSYIAHVDLAEVLVRAVDQNALHAFFLYLHHHGWMAPVLAGLRQRPEATGAVLQEVSGMDLGTLARDFKRWFATDSLRIPSVEGSAFVHGERARLVERQLAARFAWDEQARMWLPREGQGVMIRWDDIQPYPP